jgi:hypothetical protein
MGDSVVDRDPLTELGIVPVDAKFASDYKQEYQDAFQMRKIKEDTWNHHYWQFQWRSLSYEHWRRGLRYIGTLERFLTTGIPGMMGGAPWELVELAKLVEREIPDAEFRVEFFGYDPILRVMYRNGERLDEACLGIWEGSTIKAIATRRR